MNGWRAVSKEREAEKKQTESVLCVKCFCTVPRPAQGGGGGGVLCFHCPAQKSEAGPDLSGQGQAVDVNNAMQLGLLLAQTLFVAVSKSRPLPKQGSPGQLSVSLQVSGQISVNVGHPVCPEAVNRLCLIRIQSAGPTSHEDEMFRASGSQTFSPAGPPQLVRSHVLRMSSSLLPQLFL
ncbi:hypothetical protein ILYODFUR_015839 [Ilyodon furcidens]|uniref:Uncharacterized protein n=1 Tax=Ilyodon furcidens TaxID=33524 RepID=A0ABV0UGF4_9TELE